MIADLMYSPIRKGIEASFSIYGLMMGLSMLTSLMDGGNPLAWGGLTREASFTICYLFGIFGLVHFLGVKINGHWRWSPIIRFFGVLGHTAILLYLFGVALGVAGGSTAVPTYLFLSMCMSILSIKSYQDCLLAIKNRKILWT